MCVQKYLLILISAMNFKMQKISIFFVKLLSALALVTSQPLTKSPIIEDYPNEILFTAAKPFELKCQISGNAKGIRYSWTKDGDQLDLSNLHVKQNEASLTFSKPNSEDSGIYRCFAESEFGVASSRKLVIKEAFIDKSNVEIIKHKPTEGKPYKLECNIPDAYPKPTILWMRHSDTKPAETILNRRILQDPNGHLWFSNITAEDISKENKYVCIGRTPASVNDIVLAEHYLEELVVEKDEDRELLEQYVSEDMTVKAGDKTMIYCIFGGTPLAHPDWFKDGTNVNNKPGDRVTRHNRSSGRRLLIKNTYLEDEGNYTCVVDNGVGTPQSRSMFLTVVSAPEFSSKPEPRTSSSEDNDIIIPCEVYAHPTPTITWTFNKKPLLIPEAQVIIDEVGNKTVANLELKNIKKHHAGYYGCEAENEYGNIYGESLLVVL